MLILIEDPWGLLLRIAAEVYYTSIKSIKIIIAKVSRDGAAKKYKQEWSG